MAVATFTKTGTKATTPAKLDKAVFGVDITSHDLLKQAYLAYLANGRLNLAVTKTRGDVRGGGKKPWRQKGTGRARFGSSRNPIWRGGGITFGPTGHENYTHKLPTQTKRLAIRQALSVSLPMMARLSLSKIGSLKMARPSRAAAKFFEKDWCRAQRPGHCRAQDRRVDVINPQPTKRQNCPSLIYTCL